MIFHGCTVDLSLSLSFSLSLILSQIPRNTRMIYVHSWQSLVWNKIASWRIRELGRAVQIGDIVGKPTNKLSKEAEPYDKHGEEDVEEKCSDDGDSSSDVEFVNEDNISSYSFKDVLLPLPGWNVKLPKNRCKSVSHCRDYIKML